MIQQIVQQHLKLWAIQMVWLLVLFTKIHLNLPSKNPMAAANGGPHPRPLTEDVVKPDQALFDSLCNQFK